ncbi:MAG: pyridoxal phosphate-dependent aminotransferase, partial [Fimbriimonadaceae bacterium]
LNPGDEVIIPEPLYANYLGFAVEAGIRVRPIATRIEDDFALPDVEAFEEAIGPRTRAILLCNPSNPTGTVFTADQLDRLRDVVLRHDLFLIADEVYRDFNYTGRPIRSVLQLDGLERHAVMVDSVSKRFSLCGARIGFLASRNPDILSAALKLAQARLSPPTVEQIGVEGALDTAPDYFDKVRAEYQARRDLLVERLRAMPGVLCPRIDGAFYAMVRLPIDDADAFCRWLLESFRLEGQTVMLAPGTGFYATPGGGKDEVRIAYVLRREDLSAAMDCLERALREYPGHRG